jgi:serine protease AprX
MPPWDASSTTFRQRRNSRPDARQRAWSDGRSEEELTARFWLCGRSIARAIAVDADARACPGTHRSRLPFARSTPMNRWLTLAACALIAAGCRENPPPMAPQASPSLLPTITSTIDRALAAELESASPTQRLVAIVNYDTTATTSVALASAVQRLGAGVLRFKHLPMMAVLATAAQLTSIPSLTGVQSLHANKKLTFLLAESRATIKADQVQALGYTGKGIGVAILDSGIDGLYNPGLKYPTKTVANAKILLAPNDLFTFDDSDPVKLGGMLFAENLPVTETSMGHGTHVAGIVAGDGSGSSAGIYKGVAPGAHLIGISTGDGPVILYALAGFDYILENQAKYNIKVVNNSWGTTGDFDPEDPINRATKLLHDRGVTVVFAAGNEGPDQNTLNPYSVAPWVIGVAAGCKLVVDPTNSAARCQDADGRAPVLAGFSSRGRPDDPLYHPDITAPGVNIVSTRASTGTIMNGLDLSSDARTCNIAIQHVQYFTCASGTSMATPHIAGVVALMQEAARGTLTPDQVLKVLTRTARPLPGYAPWEVGAGYVDALAAVKAVRK